MSRIFTESTKSWPTWINEHHLDNDHAGDQIGKVQRDHIDDWRQRIRKGVDDDDAEGDSPFSRAISI